MTTARALYFRAAREFGHFDAIHALSRMNEHGLGGERNVHMAFYYAGVSAGMGDWQGYVRRGMDQYLLSRELDASHVPLVGGVVGHATDAVETIVGRSSAEGTPLTTKQLQRLAEWRAVANYVVASVNNVVVAKGNAAYLLRRRIIRPSTVDRDTGLQLLHLFDGANALSHDGSLGEQRGKASLRKPLVTHPVFRFLGHTELHLLQSCAEAPHHHWGVCGGSSGGRVVGGDEAL